MLIFNQLRFPFSSLHLLASCILFHTARHTFATTVSLCQGLPLETLQKVMGHKSIRTTQIYAKIVDKKLHKDMGDLAEKIKEMNIQLNLNNK